MGAIRPDIAKAADGVKRKFGYKAMLDSELTLLSNRLADKKDEHVTHLAGGYEGGKLHLLVLTTERVIVRKAGLIGKSVDYGLADIASIQWVNNGFKQANTVIITATESKTEVRLVEPAEGQMFVDAVRVAVQKKKLPSTAASAVAKPDIVGQIRQLGELHQAGILTDEEFSAKKAELLKRL